jgi:hypothetical protein
MVAEKGKDVVQDEFGKVKTNIDSTFTGFNNQANTLVDGKFNEVTRIYEDAKKKVSMIPGGL